MINIFESSESFLGASSSAGKFDRRDKELVSKRYQLMACVLQWMLDKQTSLITYMKSKHPVQVPSAVCPLRKECNIVMITLQSQEKRAVQTLAEESNTY
ncbi:uncharacterized protein PHALS_15204 [Plasmopara halstedii]|uniref:Uncharacterized protein n=1 Tax=Plasmopara halstedii TaxID=4781 RepID=A0A0P1B400_PLAHL|nr:uncharacterized protein PHALS_15204 [Plasmopara halstedii]CEG49214.1 hypothetical protein PHALS_15204 [Plasmopara halstedii]|eukprot:XP_024585583.1 hypothetical protein PHALS_15204 [Plasmopara halstedii]